MAEELEVQPKGPKNYAHKNYKTSVGDQHGLLVVRRAENIAAADRSHKYLWQQMLLQFCDL